MQEKLFSSIDEGIDFILEMGLPVLVRGSYSMLPRVLIHRRTTAANVRDVLRTALQSSPTGIAQIASP